MPAILAAAAGARSNGILQLARTPRAPLPPRRSAPASASTPADPAARASGQGTPAFCRPVGRSACSAWRPEMAPGTSRTSVPSLTAQKGTERRFGCRGGRGHRFDRHGRLLARLLALVSVGNAGETTRSGAREGEGLRVLEPLPEPGAFPCQTVPTDSKRPGRGACRDEVANTPIHGLSRQ